MPRSSSRFPFLAERASSPLPPVHQATVVIECLIPTSSITALRLIPLQLLKAPLTRKAFSASPASPPQAYRLERATTGIFSMLHIRPVLGRDFLPSDADPGAAPVVMIGYTVWQNRYAGSPSVIGRRVSVNEQPATIIGVMPKGFMFPTIVALWMPLVPTPNDLKRDNRQLQAFGLLHPGIQRPAAQAELAGIAKRLAAQYPDTNKSTTALVMSFQERYNGGDIKAIFLLM